MIIREILARIITKKKLIKFLISGSLAAFVNLFSLFIFHGLLYIHVVIAASMSFVLAYFVSFSLQKFWTFADNSQDKLYSQMFKYLLVGLFGLLITAGGMYVLVERLFVWYLLAQIFITAFMAIVNYFLYKLIFKDDITEKKKDFDCKRILIATGIYPPDIGGPATYSKTLKHELKQKGMDVVVVCYGEVQARDKENNIYRVSRKQGVLVRYVKYFLYVWKLAKSVDLVYIQGPVSEGLPSYFAARLRRKKYILKVVGDFAWEQASQRCGVKDNLDEFQNKNYAFKTEIWRMIEIFVANGASKIITPSEYLKRIVLGWGIKETGIKVIYNSVEIGPSERLRDSLRVRHGLSGAVVVSASRLVPWKGFGTLIEVMKEIDGTLIIIGEGPEEANLRFKIKDSCPTSNRRVGLESKVKLLGRLDQTKLWEYIALCDVFVLNTSYEGLSHLIIETMGIGTPVVTTRVGGNPELIEHEVNGLLVDYDDKLALTQSIKRILKDKELAKKFRDVSMEKSKVFNREKMIDDLLNLVKNL